MIDKNFPQRRAITRNFRSGVPRNLHLAHDGSDVLFLRSDSGTDPVHNLWYLSLSSGDSVERKIADTHELMGETDEQLPAAEQARRERMRESSSGITAFSSDLNHSKVCFALSGALWVHDVESGANYRKVASGVTTPTLDPTGKRIAFTRAGSLCVISTDDDPSERAVALCESTVGTETWGSAEFIAAEEMGRYSGFWWSPDGQRLLVARVDETPVDQWWISDPASPERQPRAVRYPAAGTENASVRLFVVGIDQERVEVTWDHDAYEYLARVNWSRHGDPVISVQSRDQQSVAVLTVDPDTGNTTTTAVREQEPWIDPTSPTTDSAVSAATTTPQPEPPLAPTTPTTDSAANPATTTPQPMPWIDLVPGVPRQTSHGLLDVVVDAECDTRRVVLLTDAQQYLTPPHLQVHSVQDADVDGITFVASQGRNSPQHEARDSDNHHGITFVASQGRNSPQHEARGSGNRDGVTPGPSEGPVTQDLFRVDYSGSIQRLSQPGGWSTGTSVPNAFATTRADPEIPTSSVSITVGDRRHTLANHSESPGVRPRPEFLAAGSADLDTAVLWPSAQQEVRSDPLPIIMSPYGGPHAQRAIRAASAFVTEQWIADQGYCVVVSDGPGTPRTPSFEHSIHGDLATRALQGQVAALRAVVARYGDRVDPDRVGIRGWSFGGYLAALAVLERPDLFHAAVAGAPVTDWALYDTHYTERYLGKPQDNPEVYRNSGLIAKAHKLKRPLLLIHGLSDDNVFAAHTLRLSSALLAAGRAHSVLPLTGVTHMAPQEVVAENLLRLDFEFLQGSLAGPT